MKSYLRLALVAAVSFALGAGLVRLPLPAGAAAAALQPTAIDLLSIPMDSVPTSAAFPNLHSKTLVVTDGMTAALQMGTAPKHYHADANEVQIVLAGTGNEWLGDQQVALKPGMMLVIPKGTNHAGLTNVSPDLRFVSFKTPPQDPSDVHFVK
jgi:mannose-6-phosphate isomerase-like protein (cupin superfamily)